MNTQIVELGGDAELKAIVFNKEGEYGEDCNNIIDYVIEPDMVICENGIGKPTKMLNKLVGF